VTYEKGIDFKNPYIYYLDFSEKLKYKGPFDKNGIPLLDYKGDIGIRYNPCAIAQYGLGALSHFAKTKSEDSFKKFLSVAEWLSENLKKLSEKKDVYSWLYDFDIEAYSVKAPWQSALSQGQGISLLVRVHKITGIQKFAMKAEQAFQSFLINVENGGVRRELNNGVIFEEVPSSKPSCILDGFIFSLFGLMDLYVFGANPKAKEQSDAGSETLEKILPQYDMKFWSRADLYRDKPKMIASTFYHKLHIDQLNTLYRVTGRSIFKDYSERWNAYLESKLFLSAAVIYKALFKLLYY
jgi:hypothetical protein